MTLNLLMALSGRPWAIRAEVAAHVRGLIAKEGIGALRELAGLKAQVHAASVEARRGRGTVVASSVAVIPLIGTLTQRGDIINSEATRSTAEIADEVTAMVAEPKVGSIVLEVDSPGGEVFGVPEAFASIREAAKSKPVIAAVNSVAASAAYYLASAATELWLTPSGEVGSVGVFALHVDASRSIEELGERWEFIEAGESPFKTEQAPDRPLSDDARGALQETVDRYMGFFLRDVARGRGVPIESVRRDFGRGRMVGPEAAKAARMVDQIGTLEQAIRRAGQLGREKRRGVPAEARAEGFFGGPGIAAQLGESASPDGENSEQADALDRLRSL
jgi:signal peptide peptidase SppA